MHRPFVGIIAIAGAWIFSIASYARLPDRVTTHWNAEFEADGSSPRAIVALVVPALFFLLPLLAWVLPKLDPLKKNYGRFHATYWFFWNLMMMFIASIHVVIIGSGLGWNLDVARIIPLLVGGLFAAIGNVMPRMRPNWFMGIRTPWTLSSEEVWRRTHRVGGAAFMAAGLGLALVGALPLEWARSAMWIAAVVVAAAVPVAYSYVAWRRLGRPARPA